MMLFDLAGVPCGRTGGTPHCARAAPARRPGGACAQRGYRGTVCCRHRGHQVRDTHVFFVVPSLLTHDHIQPVFKS